MSIGYNKIDLSHFLIIGLAPKPNLRFGPNKYMTLWKPLYSVCVLIAKNGNLGIIDINIGGLNKNLDLKFASLRL